MGKANLDKLTFGAKPTEGLEVEDVFDGNTVKNYKAGVDTGGKLLSDVFPSVKPNMLSKLINDEPLNSHLKVNGISLEKLISGVKRDLPPGVGFNDLASVDNLVGGFDVIARLKRDIDAESWRNVNSGMLLNLLKDVPMFQGVLNNDNQFKCSLVKKGLLGGLNGKGNRYSSGVRGYDDAIKYGWASAVMAALLGDCGGIADGDIVSSLTGFLGLSEDANDSLVMKVIGMAATVGKVALVVVLATTLLKKFTPKHKRVTIKQLLQGFRFRNRRSAADMDKDAYDFLTALNKLQPNWWKYNYEAQEDGCFDILDNASSDALLAIERDEELVAMAIIYRDRRIAPTNAVSLMREQFPNMVF